MNPWPVAGALMLIVALEMHLFIEDAVSLACVVIGVAFIRYGMRLSKKPENRRR